MLQKKVIKLGFEISIESGAGLAADIFDEAYQEVGMKMVNNAETLWKNSDIIMKVRAPEKHHELAGDEVELFREGQHLISYIWPAQNAELMQRLANKKVTVLAMDSIPQMSRAQKMDALSSMAHIAG
jgi:NAD(P) transhydrogenase subunit alpha